MPIKTQKTGKRKQYRNKTRNKRYQKAGGILFDSNREKIVNHLLKTKAINKKQKNIILDASSSGSNKTDKIKKFVNEAVSALIINIYESWKLLSSDIKQNKMLHIHSKYLNTAEPSTSIGDQNNIMNGIFSEYEKLDEGMKIKLIDDGLNKVELGDGRNGGNAYNLLYQLYKTWIQLKVLDTLPDPKFADLYSKWFGKPIKSFIEKYWWLFV